MKARWFGPVREVELPGGGRAVIPGKLGWKLVALIPGLVAVAGGIWWLEEPLRLVWWGERSKAEVTGIWAEQQGQPPRRLDPAEERNEVDAGRTAAYHYAVAWVDRRGVRVETRLNYAQRGRPRHRTGDPLTVVYDPGRPERVFVVESLTTWTFGVYFLGVGLLLLIPQGMILWAAEKPIRVDPMAELDLPEDK